MSKITACILLFLVGCLAIELVFQPLQSRHFLVLAAYREAISAPAVFVGFVAAGLAFLSAYIVTNAQYNNGSLRTVSAKMSTVVALLGAPVMGYAIGWYTVSTAFPVVQHHLTTQEVAEVPFRITGFSFDRLCRGLRATNPTYADDKLCGVERLGNESEWRGRTIFVSGMQSSFGLMIQGYRFGDQ